MALRRSRVLDREVEQPRRLTRNDRRSREGRQSSSKRKRFGYRASMTVSTTFGVRFPLASLATIAKRTSSRTPSRSAARVRRTWRAVSRHLIRRLSPGARARSLRGTPSALPCGRDAPPQTRRDGRRYSRSGRLVASRRRWLTRRWPADRQSMVAPDMLGRWTFQAEARRLQVRRTVRRTITGRGRAHFVFVGARRDAGPLRQGRRVALQGRGPGVVADEARDMAGSSDPSGQRRNVDAPAAVLVDVHRSAQIEALVAVAAGGWNGGNHRPKQAGAEVGVEGSGRRGRRTPARAPRARR